MKSPAGRATTAFGTLVAWGGSDETPLFPVLSLRAVICVPTSWEATSPITDRAMSSSSMFSSLFMRLAIFFAVSSPMMNTCSPGKPAVKSALTEVTISGRRWRKASRFTDST